MRATSSLTSLMSFSSGDEVPKLTRSVTGQGISNNPLRFANDRVEVRLTLEALRVELVHVFGAGWPGCEPAVFGDDLQPADGGIIARSASQLRRDRLTRKRRILDIYGR